MPPAPTATDRYPVSAAGSSSTIALSERIAALADMPIADVRREWSQAFGTPPTLRSVDLLRLVLAWRLQSRAHGGLDPATRRKLRRKGLPVARGLELGAGTRLTRVWQGIPEEVVVEADGFSWKGARYPSLSAVATAITGTRWNGPKFFGLEDQR